MANLNLFSSGFKNLKFTYFSLTIKSRNNAKFTGLVMDWMNRLFKKRTNNKTYKQKALSDYTVYYMQVVCSLLLLL